MGGHRGRERRGGGGARGGERRLGGAARPARARPRGAALPHAPRGVTPRYRRPMPDDRQDYDIRLDEKYGHLALIDVGEEAAGHEPWFNQTLTSVNDAVVRVGVLDGDFHWHKHDDTDEFFLVIDGRLLIDLEDRDTVTLDPHQGYTVPRGVVHRTRAPGRATILMVEQAGVEPTGD